MATTLPSKILLIDSDPQFAYLMKRYADYCGCLLIQAEWTADIVNLVEKEEPDIIFVSVSNPEADYAELLRTLKSRAFTSKIPAVLCSASEAALRDWALEAEDCLIQPIEYTDFTRVISEVGLDILIQKDCS